MTEGTVYVVQEPGQHATKPQFNLEPARRYGRLKFLLPWSLSPDLEANARLYDDAAETLRRGLADYDPATDYVLPLGAPALMLLAGAILAEQDVATVRALYWNRREGRYQALTARLLEFEPQA